MLLTSLFAQARALCRARGKSGRGVGAARKRPHARRASFERLEVREVLSGGIVVTAIGAATNQRAYTSFLDSDDKIVVAGTTWPFPSSPYQDFAALRFQRNGALDTTFGGGGKVVTPVTNFDDAASAAVIYPASSTDPEKILVAGYARSRYSYRGSTYENSDFALARYNTNGTLDSTFGGQGTVVSDLGGGNNKYGTYYTSEYIKGVAVLSDGRIVAAGHSSVSPSGLTLACYTPVGALDPAFGSGGVVKASFPGISNFATNAVVALNDDNILVVGNVNIAGLRYMGLARYTPNGTLDQTFGTGGIVTAVADGTEDNYAVAVALQPDNKIVVVGDAGHRLSDGGIYYDVAVARYLPSGALDLDFGQDGFVLIDAHATGLGDLGHSVAIQTDGKIVVATDAHTGSFESFGMFRLNADGSLDNGIAGYDTTPGDRFGADGTVVTPILSGLTPLWHGGQARSIVIQAEGKIVLTGNAWDAGESSYQRALIALARYMPDGSLDQTFVGDTPSLAINDVSKAEGNGGWTTPTAFTFTVTRSGNLAEGASVDYGTANGTAAAGSDYTAIPTTTLTFAPGEVTKTITVLVNGDKLKESNETFYIDLSGAVGATIADGRGIGTILSDDGKTTSGTASAAATDAALADAGRQHLALAALLQYEDQLQAKPAARSKGLEVPAIDLALMDLAS